VLEFLKHRGMGHADPPVLRVPRTGRGRGAEFLGLSTGMSSALTENRPDSRRGASPRGRTSQRRPLAEAGRRLVQQQVQQPGPILSRTMLNGPKREPCLTCDDAVCPGPYGAALDGFHLHDAHERQRWPLSNCRRQRPTGWLPSDIHLGQTAMPGMSRKIPMPSTRELLAESGWRPRPQAVGGDRVELDAERRSADTAARFPSQGPPIVGANRREFLDGPETQGLAPDEQPGGVRTMTSSNALTGLEP
jgi:hypothetical protein